MRHLYRLAACLLLAALIVAVPAAAQARVFFGFAPVFVAPAFAYPVPLYAPPPYYAPPVYAPPVYAPPASYGAPVAAPGTTCYAGRYVCPLEVAHPINDSCACPTEGNGRAEGTVR